MASNSLFAKGTALQRKNPSTGTYEAVPQVSNISTPQITADEEEITNHDSTGSYKEFAQTLKDGGQVDFEIVYDPANAMHQQLFSDMTAGTLLTWRIVLPGAVRTFQFDGFLRQFGGSLNASSIARMSASIRISGAPTLT